MTEEGYISSTKLSYLSYVYVLGKNEKGATLPLSKLESKEFCVSTGYSFKVINSTPLSCTIGQKVWMKKVSVSPLNATITYK